MPEIINLLNGFLNRPASENPHDDAVELSKLIYLFLHEKYDQLEDDLPVMFSVWPAEFHKAGLEAVNYQMRILDNIKRRLEDEQ